jgi:hypothetical protein
MAKSTGIVLSATGISFANEWVQTDRPNFRVLLAGGAVALLFDGIEQVNKQIGVGLSVLMMITVIVTPFAGNSPAQELAILGAMRGKKIGGSSKHSGSGGVTQSHNQQAGGQGTASLTFPGGSGGSGSGNPPPVVAPPAQQPTTGGVW